MLGARIDTAAAATPLINPSKRQICIEAPKLKLITQPRQRRPRPSDHGHELVASVPWVRALVPLKNRRVEELMLVVCRWAYGSRSEPPSHIIKTENFSELHNPDAYLVVYSVTSKRSLQLAKEILRLIHKWDNVDSKALILVGNKTDLARHRVLSTEDETPKPRLPDSIDRPITVMPPSRMQNTTLAILLIKDLPRYGIKDCSYSPEAQKSNAC
ncbi:GTP-binding protein GEM [Trichonephila clavipes]|nr:GTP-binding protein GEM [Trichonephila clavipes]